MNKMIFLAVMTALLVAGCSDKDDTATGTTEPSMLEKAKESTRDAMSDIKGATSEVVGSAKKMASDTASTVGDAASGAMDSAGDMASKAKTAVTAAAGSAMGSASEMASDATESVAKVTAAEDEVGDGGAAGAQVYKNSCQSCHAMGVAGAPKLGDKAAWAPRIAAGMDALYTNSIKGKGIMPPRGACATCSDGDLKAAVQYMVSQSR